MPDKCFWDSNLWVYLNTFSQDVGDVEKRQVLEKQLLSSAEIVVSTQVVNELANVLFKKYHLSEAEVKSRLEQILLQVEVVPLTEVLSLQALTVKSRYRISWYDSLIVSAALIADCHVLYTEDLQHGLVVEEHLQVINPFTV